MGISFFAKTPRLFLTFFSHCHLQIIFFATSMDFLHIHFSVPPLANIVLFHGQKCEGRNLRSYETVPKQ